MAGTLRKRGKNSYYLEYMCDGERYSQTVKANSQTEASKKLAIFVTEVEKGKYRKDSGMTFTEFAQMFFDEYANDNLSPTTVKDYKNRINKYIADEIGTIKINKLKRLQIQELANKLVKEYNLSSKTAKNDIALISSILNKGIEWDYLDYNVADKISIPKNLKKQKKKVILYSYDEIKTFLKKLEKLKDKELQIAIYTSFYTGARRGEVLALTFKDFNFKKCTIDFNKNKVAVKGGTQEKDIKNGKNRLFYVPKNYIDKVEAYYKQLGKPKKETKLFNMHPDTFSKEFKKFLSDNKLRDINLKDLRALNESILVNKGIDVVSAAKRIGHLPSTGVNYYLDQIPEEDKKASEILENLF